MWMEERGGPINLERVQEAARTGADTLAVACPFCTVMLDDGVQTAGEQLRVVDVATLLAETVQEKGAGEPAAAPAPVSRRSRAPAARPPTDI
jgi:Fe-S oxidoreductase